jgi:probable HAF family extracellular repeat protein
MFAMAIFGGVGTAFADISYSFTTLDVPGASVTQASGVNSSGQIVGDFVDDAFGLTHGFLYSDGSFTTIDVPGASRTIAEGINVSGQIAGGFQDAIGSHAFLYNGGSFSTIDYPGFIGETLATGINDSGQADHHATLLLDKMYLNVENYRRIST